MLFIIKLAIILLTTKTILISASYFDGDDPKNSFLTINTTSSSILVVTRRNKECSKCMFNFPAHVKIDQNETIEINTDYPTYFFQVENQNTGNFYCENLETTFGESGEYLLEITKNNETNSTECSFKVLKNPTNKYTPIIAALLIYLSVTIFYNAGRYIFKTLLAGCFDNETENETAPLNRNAEATINEVPVMKIVKKSSRIESVDTLRGICLCIMIFVNYGAGDYAFFDHAVWNGLHLADLVFPCFVFLMGVSISLSFYAITSKARTQDGRSTLKFTQLAFKCMKRTILLFLFGLLVSNGTVSLSQLRIMGVLQRFAVSYLVCAMLEIIYLHFTGFTYELQESFEQLSWKSNFKEIFLYKFQWLVMMIITLVWLLITFVMPVPGCPTGYIGPGGLHENASHVNCTGGAAGYLDRQILGYYHVYSSPTCQDVYKTEIPYDPEGLLGSLTSCLMTYLGVIAGHIFIHYKEPSKRVMRFISYGIIYGVMTLILTKASKDDGWIPINKNLWSISFILAIASIALPVLSVLYLIVDVRGWYSGVPFIFPGKNSICKQKK
jgi:heparan-alpha-glucosaminide N-acetyltransferase